MRTPNLAVDRKHGRGCENITKDKNKSSKIGILKEKIIIQFIYKDHNNRDRKAQININ